MAKVRKRGAKKPAKCPCLKGWVCEDHPNQPWGHDGCEAAGELCKNPRCDKDPDSIFLSVHCLEEEDHQSEKLHLTLKGLGKRGVRAIHCFSNIFIFSSS